MTDAEYAKFIRLWLAGATTAELAAECDVDIAGVREWQQWALSDPAAVKDWTGRPEPIGRSLTCAWISGDTAKPGWSYCNARSLPGRSWCGAHAVMARLGQREQPKKVMRAWR